MKDIMNEDRLNAIQPLTLGWLDYKLNSKELDYLWRCIENKKEGVKEDLVGHISNSYRLIDRGDWFFMNIVSPLIYKYEEKFGFGLTAIPTNQKHPYYMERWWVNYQKQMEFNPSHNHKGVYSFVIWMKIPYNWKGQNQKDIARKSNEPQIGSFQFTYSDILGEVRHHRYNLSSQDEGTMLFFPSRLYHQVYPFYDCNEDRISVSGNVSLNTTKII